MTSKKIRNLLSLQPEGVVATALALRADVLEMTEATEAAVLTPKEPGGLSHGVRVALALRIARLHGCETLVSVYDDTLRQQQADEATVALADPGFNGGDDVRSQKILAFTDQIATSPKDTTAADIESLSNAGLAEADIVRLTQLNAFLAYKIRVVEGLRLMGASV